MYFPDPIKDIVKQADLWWYDDTIDKARHFVSRNSKKRLNDSEKELIKSYLVDSGFYLEIIFDN